jgi:hypothetical protein
MASIETGRRETSTPDGKVITQINVSTTGVDEAATNPSRPAKSRLVSREWTNRPDGARDYVFTFENIGDRTIDPEQQINGQAAQEPIETHPSFNGAQDGGTVSDADLAAIKAALSAGSEPQFTATGADLTAAQGLYNLMLKGVTHYYTPSGITYSETNDEDQKPSLIELCRVSNPPPDAPNLLENSNWLMIGMRAQRIYEPEKQTRFWRVTREWLASGPRGWNADFDIYK